MPEQCNHYMGPDRCRKPTGHDGDHRARWHPLIVCEWATGDEHDRVIGGAR